MSLNYVCGGGGDSAARVWSHSILVEGEYHSVTLLQCNNGVNLTPLHSLLKLPAWGEELVRLALTHGVNRYGCDEMVYELFSFGKCMPAGTSLEDMAMFRVRDLHRLARVHRLPVKLLNELEALEKAALPPVLPMMVGRDQPDNDPVIFPSVLPTENHDYGELTLDGPYGIRENELPSNVRSDVGAFARWCTQDINLSRGEQYSKAVQDTTITKQLECIRAYLGFVDRGLDISIRRLSLRAYWQPESVARFVAFLLNRGCSRNNINKHLGIAKKVRQNEVLVQNADLFFFHVSLRAT